METDVHIVNSRLTVSVRMYIRVYRTFDYIGNKKTKGVRRGELTNEVD